MPYVCFFKWKDNIFTYIKHWTDNPKNYVADWLIKSNYHLLDYDNRDMKFCEMV